MPHSSEDSAANVNDRLTNLEIKTSFNEDLLDRLDQIIIRQQDQIDRQEREIERLRQQPTEPQPGAFRSLRDELPPHY